MRYITQTYERDLRTGRTIVPKSGVSAGVAMLPHHTRAPTMTSPYPRAVMAASRSRTMRQIWVNATNNIELYAVHTVPLQSVVQLMPRIPLCIENRVCKQRSCTPE
jgi:hypothetical protein